MKTNSLDFDAQALRERILDLAMRGKLVPQDPNDEPASVLLDKIKAEKAELIKEKKIKKTKSLPPITDDEKPFDIPDSWEWVRLGDVGTITSGGTPKTSEKSYWEEGKIPWITPAVMSASQNDIVFNNKDVKYINNLGLEKSSAHLIQKDSLVVSSRAPIGYVNIVPFEYTTNQGCKSVSLYDDTNKQFIYFAIKNAVPEMNRRASGTTFKEISGTKFGQTIVPLPPLSEQSRIAAKIAQLFALLRKVESSTQQYAKLQTLLKSKVLDLAVRGKLVKQDPNDEPAGELLKKIKAEKAELIKEKKIKKSKPLPPITDDEKPFDIPDSWEWARLGDLVSPVEYAMADGPFGSNLKKADYTNQPEVRIVQLSNIGENGWKDDNVKYTTFDHLKLIRRSEVFPGNIVIAKMMPAGRAILIPNKDKKYVLSSDAVKFIPTDLLNKQFLLNAINSNVYRDQVNKKLQGTTRPRTSLKKLKNFVLPIPPIQEQKRILSKLSMLKQDLI